MGTGYTRNDTANNIADGNVINASDLDGEFDAVQAAFNGTTGHSHDGTSGEGPQIAAGGIASNAVTTAKILDGNVTTAKIADLNVTTGKIANDAVTLGTKTSGNYVAAGATSGTGISGSVSSEGGTFTVTSNATNANTAGTIVARDGSGNFSAGTITASLTGTASNANQLDSLDSTQFLRSDAADTKTSGNLKFNTNVRAEFGTTTTLSIYSDGTTSIISEGGTGSLNIDGSNLRLRDTSGNKYIEGVDNGTGGTVTLYHNAVAKLATKSDGVDITGELQSDSLDVDGNADISGNLTMSGAGNIDLSDGASVRFGASQDLTIRHSGTNSFIEDNGTGSLYIDATNFNIRSTSHETYLTAVENGAVSLYYDNASKLATKSDGVDITGELQSDSLDVDGNADISGTLTLGGNLNMGDNDLLQLGASSDLRIYHDGTDSRIHNQSTGRLILRNDVNDQDIQLQTDDGSGGLATYVTCDGSNGQVQLNYYGSTKLNTKSDGVLVTGELEASSLDINGDGNMSGTLTMGGNIDMQDNDQLKIGTGDDLLIYHDGSQSYIINNGSNNLYLQNNVNDKDVYILTDDGSGGVTFYFQADGSSGEARLFHYGTQKLNTTSGGININGAINAVDDITLAGSIYHEGDTDSYFGFHAANQWRIVTGNTEMLEVNDSYILLGANTRGNVQTANVNGGSTPNFYTYNSFVWTLTGNTTLSNPSTETGGMSGVFIFIQDGTGSRTLSLGTDYETAGGAGITLSTAPNAVDIVPYFVQSSGNILLGTPQLAFS